MNDINENQANYLTPDCKAYSMDAQTGNLQCKSCVTGFVITTEKKCQASNNIENCALLQKDDKQRYNCIECLPGYIFLNKACIKGTIPNCEIYTFT